MEKLLGILNKVNSDVDYNSEKFLIEERILDSIQIVYLIQLISSEYNIEIQIQDLIPENFNSIEAIWNLIEKYH